MSLSRLELSILRIAASRAERPAIITDRTTGLWERLAILFMGRERAQPLADPRLEALRALAAALHRRPPLPVSDFLQAGWSPADLSAVVLAIAGQSHSIQQREDA